MWPMMKIVTFAIHLARNQCGNGYEFCRSQSYDEYCRLTSATAKVYITSLNVNFTLKDLNTKCWNRSGWTNLSKYMCYVDTYRNSGEAWLLTIDVLPKD
jgi:hypothetical protein